MADSIEINEYYKYEDHPQPDHPSLGSSYKIRPARSRTRGTCEALQYLMHALTASRLVITRVNERGRQAIIGNATA